MLKCSIFKMYSLFKVKDIYKTKLSPLKSNKKILTSLLHNTKQSLCCKIAKQRYFWIKNINHAKIPNKF